MNKLLQKLAKLTLGLAMAAGVGVAVGTGHKNVRSLNAAPGSSPMTSIFKDKDWGVSSGDTWSSTTSGYGYSSTRGVQITKGNTGKAVSTETYTSVSKITVTGGSASSGEGSIKVKVGSGTEQTWSIGKNTSDTPHDFNFSPAESGQVTLTVAAKSGSASLYCKQIVITHGGGGTQYSYSISYNGNGNTGGDVPQSASGTASSVTISSVQLTKEGYEHDGWALSENGNIEYTLGQQVTLSGQLNVSLYAHWTKISKFAIVHDINELSAGARYLISSYSNSTDYFMSKEQKDQNRGAISLEVDEDDIVTETSNVEVFVLGGDETNGWTFAPTKGSAASGNVIYAAGGTSNNYLKTGALTSVGDKGRFAVTVPTGQSGSYIYFKVQAKDTNTSKDLLCFNYNGGTNTLFSCYSSVPSGGSSYIYLYKELIHLQTTDTLTLSSSLDLNSNNHTLSGSVAYSSNLSETLTISSSNTNVAEIQNISHSYATGSSTFEVLGKANGTTTISVTGDSSGVVLSQEVTVLTSLNGIVVPEDDVSVGLEQEYYLYNAISFDPETTTQRELTFGIEDGPENGAEIRTGDLFYATEEGRYEISVMDENSNSYTFYISVVLPFEYSSLEATSSTKYHLGDAFNKSGVSITAVLTNDNGDEQRNPVDSLDNTISWTIPNDFATAIGTAYSIGISYTIDQIEKSTTISVTLEAITNIEVVSHNVPNSLLFGSQASAVTATVKAYTLSEASGFTANSSYVNIGTINTSKLGEQQISVTYGGKTAYISTYVTNVGTSLEYKGCNVSQSKMQSSSLTGSWSGSGVGSDYATSHDPYLMKMDDTGDYFQYYKSTEVLTNASTITITLGCKKIGGAGNSSFIAYALDSSGQTIDALKTSSMSCTGAQNATCSLSDQITNNSHVDIYGIRFVFTKSANVGVGPVSISASGDKQTAMITAQGNAFVEYLGKFKTCQSGWESRNIVVNLVTEYNAMHADAKSAVDSSTLTDYDWTNPSEYNISTHQYGSGTKSLNGVSAIEKLKDMVDYYNNSRTGSEEELVLKTSTGNFTTFNSSRINILNIIGQNTNSIAIIVIISMVSVGAIGGYFFIRRRKENI